MEIKKMLKPKSLIIILLSFLSFDILQAQETLSTKLSGSAEVIDTIGDFTVYDTTPPSMMFNGEITQGDLLEFRRALRAHEDVETIILNSPGGLVYEGMELASVIHDKGLNTIVASNGSCASACSFLFFAGQTRYAEQSQLGVHQFSNLNEVGNISGIQLTAGEIIEHLNDFDTPPFIYEKMLLTSPQNMYYFDKSEISQINSATKSDVAWASQILVSSPKVQTADNSSNSLTETQPAFAPSTPTSDKSISDLSYNSIRQLQFALAIKGKYLGIIDGEWGSGSLSALVNATNNDDPSYTDALALIEFGKRTAREDGWKYWKSPSGMSLLLPMDQLDFEYNEYGNPTWSGFNGNLRVIYFEDNLDNSIAWHNAARQRSNSDINSYSVEKENRLVSSNSTSSGWSYVRSELQNGVWSTLTILNSDELPIGIANAISGSYDKRGYTFDLAYADTVQYHSNNGSVKFVVDGKTASISVAQGACSGYVEGKIETISDKRWKLIPNDDSESGCTIDLVEIDSNKISINQGLGCTYYHGAACGFNDVVSQ